MEAKAGKKDARRKRGAAVENLATGDDEEEYLSGGCQREEAVGASFREADREVALEPRGERHWLSRFRRKLPRYREEDIRAQRAEPAECHGRQRRYIPSICRVQKDF